eukprot:GILJ01032609.1.p1 GENE.GILJ01032609.1~~GILJ01032609.1.p1  ORF type:complete len:384 (+),score=55.81 GILJ01032609.1:131-1153(+)
MPGDIFSRFRSYDSAEQLQKELVKKAPEKIDIGAVYDMAAEKKSMTKITPQDRELVFDIDMSDYDHVRSCCKGKSICKFCWQWMACAAKVLAYVLQTDFGFKYLLPVFSGRRGIHLWVCDKRARELTDDERASIVGYMTVVQQHNRTAVGNDLCRGKPIHPTLDYIQKTFLAPAFKKIFAESDGSANPNSVSHPKGASIVYNALVTNLRDSFKIKEADKLPAFDAEDSEATLNWPAFENSLNKSQSTGAIAAVQFQLLYPRLDEHVSTRRDHLLKLPFCIHPGTGSLCCPLSWEVIDEFDPIADAPRIDELIQDGSIPVRWKRPLSDMLQNMAEDPDEFA